MNINIPGVTNKDKNSTKSTLPKINLSKSGIISKLDIYKENIVSFITGKLLLNELIRINKKVIGTLFAIGLISTSVYSITTNYSTFNKKMKQKEKSIKEYKEWNKKFKNTDNKYRILKGKFDTKRAGVYSLYNIKMERDLLQLYLLKLEKSTKKYVSFVLISFNEDAYSNTLEAKLKVSFKRDIMKPLLIDALAKEGYFVEKMTNKDLTIRKIKE